MRCDLNRKTLTRYDKIILSLFLYWNRFYFVILDEYPSYHYRKAVFSVEIIAPEIIGGIEIFDNVPVDKTVLDSPSNNGSIARIIMRPPNKYYPDTYFILMRIEDDDWTELFQIFYEKNCGNFETEINGNVLEIIIRRDSNNFADIKKQILKPFRKCFLEDTIFQKI